MIDDQPAVVTDKLTKQYGDLTALDHVSITVERGTILGFIGPNGAGKTTLIKILVGQARPTSGSARVAGADCMRQATQIKRLVGYMPDVFGSYDNMRVREYLDFFGAAFGISRSARIKRVAEVLDTTGASELQDRFVESLSHGMKQRIGIARTLLHDPQVLILDEPANGLDPHARVEMRTLLLDLAGMGKTLIVTSHILPELSRICDQVAMITNGRIIASGPLDKIMRMVSQRRVFEVQLVSAEQMDQAIQIISQHVEPDSEVKGSTAEAAIRFKTSRTDEKLAHVLASLVGAGVGISQYRELQTDLEDTFLSLVDQAREGTLAGTSP